jgi:cytochrome c peroxidase
MARPLVPAILFCLVVSTGARAEPLDAASVRALIDARVGGLEKLRVPANDSDLPQPKLENGDLDPLFKITEAKRHLGKLLYHDPIRSNNIKTEFGGNPSTAQSASCGSCHLGQAQSKAGQVMNFGVGGEGRMVMDSRGGFRFTRQIIPGMVDVIPTPQTLMDGSGNLLLEGHFDEVDSVPRLSPSMVGFAFNNRLLGGGAAGEPYDPANTAKLNKNPNNFPAGENLAQIAFKVHRMVSTQQFALQGNAVYRKLFADAFPEEYARSLQTGELNDYISELTVIRAVAAFLRTVITRGTPWDRFLAGDAAALTERQLRGAALFASPVAGGGADCISCHSGPALNKQLGDEEGLLIEENFFNIGIGDHPLRELSWTALRNPNHHDPGRLEVSANPTDIQKFKTPTLRQLRGGGQFMHSGELTSVRQVIDYFNAGVPASAVAVAAGNLTPRFTNPRGAGVTGLGLSEDDVEALEDFLENALHDPAFVHHDPSSLTRTFDPNVEDLTYPDELKALGARDGLLPSLMAVGNNDAMTRDETIFVRGRVTTGDATVNLADAVFILTYLLRGGSEPEPMIAADTNHDGRIDLADPIYLLRFLFLEGSPPAMPYPDEGALMP